VVEVEQNEVQACDHFDIGRVGPVDSAFAHGLRKKKTEEDSQMDTPAVRKKWYKRTEVWGVTAASVVAVLNEIFGWQLSADSIASIAIVIAGYAIGRGISKRGTGD